MLPAIGQAIAAPEPRRFDERLLINVLRVARPAFDLVAGTEHTEIMAYTVRQAKDHFSQLLKEAEAGKEATILRGNKPVAKIVAVDQPQELAKRKVGGYEGLVHADDRAFDPLTDEELAEYGFGFMLDGELVKPANAVRPAKHERTG